MSFKSKLNIAFRVAAACGVAVIAFTDKIPEITNTASNAPINEVVVEKAIPKQEVILSKENRSVFVHVSDAVFRIPQFDRFCKENPAECSFKAPSSAAVLYDENMKSFVEAINVTVNTMVNYEEDLKVYGEEERWALPAPKDGAFLDGDCEDMALMKRKMLLKHVPANAMMMAYIDDRAVVKDFSKASGHAVLIVRTMSGDIVLDTNNIVKRLIDTDYDFYGVQDPTDHSRWLQANAINSNENDQIIIALYEGRDVPAPKALRDFIVPAQVQSAHTAREVAAKEPAPIMP